MARCTEIDRLILSGGANVKDLVDLSVRKAVDTQKLLERYETFHSQSSTTRKDTKYARLSENFNRASKKLEESIRKYGERSREIPAVDRPTTQLRDMQFGRHVQPSTGSGYEYISSMEEGSRAQTLSDLTRMGKDMNSLQDMYFSLSEVASQQSTLIDSVQGRISQAATSAKNTVVELNKAKDRMDHWTRIKVYTVSGITAVGILFWLI